MQAFLLVVVFALALSATPWLVRECGAVSAAEGRVLLNYRLSPFDGEGGAGLTRGRRSTPGSYGGGYEGYGVSRSDSSPGIGGSRQRQNGGGLTRGRDGGGSRGAGKGG